MNIEINEIIYKDCLIVPFDNLHGKIIAINQSN